MILSLRAQNTVFRLLALSLVAAACYHASGLLFHFGTASPPRHGLFTCLDLFFAFGFIRRFSYFIPLFALFTVQQFYSHGQQLIQVWTNQHELHWISILVLILLPLGIVCLVAEYLKSFVGGVFTNPEAQ